MKAIFLLICLLGSLSVFVNAAAPLLPPAKRTVSKTQACVDTLDVIRRQHGDVLKKQHNETVNQGIRPSKYSITACISCHVAPDAATGLYPKISSSQHFCNACHTYVAVKIACFSCHLSMPAVEESAENAEDK
ncbi:hypothetical protein [Beggiatoa leptomitoformis]|uniref:Hdr-like menaquinol oxidoreductase cytochrome c subunit n=1 Tax=Beggiatoa leptomitoformis TaxID=288004 RepID=A0A2N9YCJ0_9GAMM|nr:hypothetical protein [Beggiatoa leptomitoformis]ALG66515.1 Hdr-like menaquinol oxidoreductase cytochrome c subunit [Beggiatoa leptomitoformis]AUI68188.1 Hdr-like menaquinol oxidoreductase cytochrome c subunit [Beggiatoa leptomitoformis]